MRMRLRVQIAVVVAVCLHLNGTALAQDTSRYDIAELQQRARRANGGALGCGVGTLTLETSRGTVVVRTGLDPMHVFGSRVRVADLIELLERRNEAIRGSTGDPMGGEVDDLCYVVLYALARSADPDVIPVVSQLLEDPSTTVSDWALIALIQLGSHDEELRELVRALTFPPQLLERTEVRGHAIPEWVDR